MTKADNQDPNLLSEIEELRAQLAEAQDTLRAIQSGEVDALVVSGPHGPSVYTLKGEERTYRVLVESVNEGALTLTPDGTIMYANSAFARMIGVPLERIVTASIESFVIESDHEALQSLLYDGRHFASRRELCLKRSHDGEPLPVYVSMSPMTLDEAHALSAVVTDLTEAKRTERELTEYRDHLEDLVRERTEELEATNEELETTNEELRAVTDEVQATNGQLRDEIEERKKAEDIVRESEARFRSVLENSRDIIYRVDMRTSRYAYISPSAKAVVGYSPDELMAMDAGTALYMIHPDDLPLMRAALERLEEDGQAEVEYRQRAKGDGYRWLSNHMSLARDNVGRPLYRDGNIRDITDKKQAEQALANRERFFRAVYDSTDDAIVVADDEGRYISGNPAVKNIFGLSQDQIVGRRISDFMETECWDEIWAEFLRQGAMTLEHKLIAADGSIKSVQTSSIANMLPGEHLAIIHDVTDEVALREQLKTQVTLLQRALLPPSPKSIEGYLVASAYIPAYAGQEIGGDFYDLFRTEAGKIGVAIGDVSGKGIEAASLAAVTRSTIRAFAYDMSSAGGALKHANALLSAQQFGRYQFVTAFLAIVDPQTGEVRYAGAGHPPGLVHCKNGVVGLLNTGGVPLGVMDTAEYEESVTTLEPGDELILYTDGVSEARTGSVLFGTEGIEQCLEMHGDEPPDALVNSILQAARDFAQGNLRDDTAIVVVQRTP